MGVKHPFPCLGGVMALCLLVAVVECGTTVTPSSPDGTFLVVLKNAGAVRLVRKSDASQDDVDHSSAHGTFADNYTKDGWGVLRVNTRPQGHASNRDTMYAAGYLEGALTHDMIYENQVNMYDEFFVDRTPPKNISKFVAAHVDWLKKEVAANPKDAYWVEVDNMMGQLEGLFEGYRDHASKDKQLTFLDFMLLNLDGDLETIVDAVKEPESRLIGQILKRRFLKYRCSGLVRVTPKNEDVFVAHSTWDSYGSMVRIYKHYAFTLSHGPTRKVSFSSSPGFLSSVDDFYMTGTNLAVVETTNGLHNNDLLKLVTPTAGVMSWMRCMIANYLATSGPQWVDLFSKYNSGTYNNQWFVVDMKKFTPGQASLQTGLLTVCEQIPGAITTGDQTSVLSKTGYWGSYNIPFYTDIYEKSGFAKQFKKHGNAFSHEHCPRANIFRRDAPKVATFDAFKSIMRYNDWQHDPLSLGSPANSIMSRYDLVVGDKKQAFGGIDTKVTSYRRTLNLEAEACNGPTTDQQSPFVWSGLSKEMQDETSHIGQVDKWAFDFVTMKP